MYTKHIIPIIVASEHEHVLLLSGEPGTGKTSFAYWLAEQVGAGVATYLCHAWSGDEDLFAGVDLPALVKGDAQNVIRPGVLRAVAEASLTERVVLLIDELDKAPARFEALLLGFLERWEYPLAPGYVGRANPDNIWVVITHNGMREITHPLQRRCFRYKMPFLPPQVEVSLLGGGKLATGLVNMANVMRSKPEMSSPSLSELKRAVKILPLVAGDKNAVRAILFGCMAKCPEDEEFIAGRVGGIMSLLKEVLRD